MFLRISTYVFILGGLTSYFFSQYYLAELSISFLPYWMVFALIITLFWLVMSIISYRKLGHKIFSGFIYLEKVVFVVLGLFLFFLYGFQLSHFYNTSDLYNLKKNITDVNHKKISVLFANLLWTNDDYQAIEDVVSQNDPDVLMFVEFSEDHYLHLGDFLSKKYPFVNRTTRSKKLMVGSIVFSKYPLKNTIDAYKQGAWRYGYFELLLPHDPYYFYLIHTSSPISKFFWNMRNKQLDTLVSDFALHEKLRSYSNVVMVGDFNLSPWAEYYDKFLAQLPDTMVDVTRESGFMFSRFVKLFDIPLRFFQVHIDHIFTTRPDEVFFDKTVYLPGSDHKALLFHLDIKNK